VRSRVKVVGSGHSFTAIGRIAPALMAEVAASRVPSDRAVILGSLIALPAAAWGLLIWQSVAMDDNMSLTMGMGAPLFIAHG